jgi:hypothetical protein
MPIIKTDSHPIINASLVDIFKLFILIILRAAISSASIEPTVRFSCATGGLGRTLLAQGRCPPGNPEIQLTAPLPLKAPVLLPLGLSGTGRLQLLVFRPRTAATAAREKSNNS